MATLNFYLDKADKQGKCPIMMTYLADGQKFRHSVKIKIMPTQWLKRKQRLKGQTREEQFINAALDKLEGYIKDAQTQSLLFNHGIEFSFVRDRFLEAIGTKRKYKISLQEAFNEYIALSRQISRPKTTDRYISCLNHLIEFKKGKKIDLSFDRVNQQFYEAFVAYLMHDKNQLNNTIGNYVKTLKSFMNFSIDRGYCSPVKDLKKFKVFKEDSELVYLTEQELLNIYNLELKIDRLKIVRDNFCFACFTGLRYSDIIRIRSENIKENYVEIKTEKTRDFLRIPLNVYSREILTRNDGKLPKLFTNQKTNDYLKEIGELAGLDEIVQIVKYRGVEKVELVEPKYKFLTTHSARRTFVTLSLEKGMRPETVMSITGHRDYKTFKKYIKLTDKVKLAEMNNIWPTKLKIA